MSQNTTKPTTFIDKRGPAELTKSAREFNNRIIAMCVQLENVFAGMEHCDADELYAMNTLCFAGIKECLADAHGIDGDLERLAHALEGGAV